jgi:hypothetical protein
MSVILKELNQLKGYYQGEFKFDMIPRYFPPTKFPKAPYLLKSWQEKEGYTDVFIWGHLHGTPGDRSISNIFLSYKPFLEELVLETREKLKKIRQETRLMIDICHYKDPGTPGSSLVIQHEGKIQIENLIEYLEKIEKTLVENVSIILSEWEEKQRKSNSS